MDPCDFAYALRALQEGRVVARRGWNGKHRLRYAHAGRAWIAGEHNELPSVPLAPFIVIFTNVQEAGLYDECRPWLASQADLLAGDWEVL